MTPTLPDTIDELDLMLTDHHPVSLEWSAWAAESITASDDFDRAAWRSAADAGLLALHAPVTAGGRGLSPLLSFVVYEGLGHGAPELGPVFGLLSQLFATQTAIQRGATDAQRDEWLRPLVSGERIMAFAMTEPEAGSDSSAITTSARAVDDGFMLDGVKTWISLAPVADDVLVFARTDPDAGAWGITAFRVPLDRDGVEVGPAIEKLGLGACPFGSITFRGVRLSHDDVLGAVGAGHRIFSMAVESERVHMYAAQLGRIRRLLERMIERSGTRQQFGVPIGSHQAVAHRIADVKLHLDAASLLLRRAAIADARGESITLQSALAKIHVAEHSITTAIAAMTVFGAEGYTVESGLGQDARDALGALSYSGTADIQRNIVARLLGVGRPVRRRSRQQQEAHS